MKSTHCNILILGAGCAGLTAGIYAARGGKTVIILEKSIPGGQAAITTRIENYPGLPDADGFSLTQAMQKQAESFGARILSCSISQIWLEEKRVRTDRGDFTADAVILATGARPRELNIPGERAFRGKGVSYCASCDGWFYKGREVVVVGGGNSACEEALHLSEYVSHVTMLVRSAALRCDAVIAGKLMENEKITVRFHTALTAIRGTDSPQSLELKNTLTGEKDNLPFTGGIFIFAGFIPESDSFSGQIEMDSKGYLLTDEALQTSLPGVFAAGDVRKKQLRQIITAAADGALAAASALSFTNEQRE